MKSRFVNIVFAFVCLIVLPFAMPAVATAADDDDSDFKLTPRQQKWLDEQPPEQRENILKEARERRKKQLQILNTQKKIILREAARPSSILEREFNESAENLRTLSTRAWNDQEFLDYVGIDKELAANISKKDRELAAGMWKKADHNAILLKIAQASTDDEVDKLIDQMHADVANLRKELLTMIKNELNPQQIEKIKELRMVDSSRNGSEHNDAIYFDFGQYEALNLTDEQQKQIAAIKTEYLAVFEPLYQKRLDLQNQNKDILFHNDLINEADISKELEEKVEKIWTEIGNTYQPITQLNTATRARILALFTKEQIAKLEKVFANAPTYLAVRAGLIKKGEKNGAWKPNENSWKPGDGPTKEYLERERLNPKPKRDRQFPTKEKE